MKKKLTGPGYLMVVAIWVLILASGCQNQPENRVQSTDNGVQSVGNTVQPIGDTGIQTRSVPSVSDDAAGGDKGPVKKVFLGRTVCVDPGHQAKASPEKEPVAPGATLTKEKMVLGALGVKTRKPESKVNMEVSLKLEKRLLALGATVVMTRREEDVTLGNIQRAQIANDAKADAFIRIHADGSSDPKVSGMSLLYPGAQYIKDTRLIQQSRQLSECIAASMADQMGKKSIKQVERNDLTGFNWSKVPVVLLEMGFLTNPEEDGLLSTEEYQNKIIEGLIAGLTKYFREA